MSTPYKGWSNSTPNVIVPHNMATHALQTYTLFTLTCIKKIGIRIIIIGPFANSVGDPKNTIGGVVLIRDLELAFR